MGGVVPTTSITPFPANVPDIFFANIMSSTADLTTANSTQDDQTIIYSPNTHSLFFQGRNVGFFSGSKTYQDGSTTHVVAYLGMVTNVEAISEWQELHKIMTTYSGKHMVSGRSKLEVDAKWEQKEEAIAEQFEVVSDTIQKLLSHGHFGPVSIWAFDSESDVDRLLGEESSKVYVLTTAPRPSNHISFQDPASMGGQDAASIAPFENPPPPTTTRRRRRRGPVIDAYPHVRILGSEAD